MKDLLSVLRWVQNPRGRLAGFRVAQLIPGLGPASARRLLDAMAAADDPLQALHAFKPPGSAARRLARLAAPRTGAARGRLARRHRARRGAGTSRTSSACTTTPRSAAPTSRSSNAWPRSTRAASASSPS